MEKRTYVVQDLRGNAIIGASVSVFVAGTTTPATIYSDNSLTVKANPTITDAKGHYSFYAANGRYDLFVSPPAVTGIADYTLSDVIFSDSGTPAPGTGQPMISGRVDSAGVKIGGGAFTSARTGLGTYTLSFSPVLPVAPIGLSVDVVTANAGVTHSVAILGLSATGATVFATDVFGSAADVQFSFSVYS